MNERLKAVMPLFHCPVLVMAPSWKCDAGCRHCFLPSVLRRNDGFNARVVEAVLRQMPEGVRIVSFTGGEPFINQRRMLGILARVHRTGRFSAVVTNGLWSRDWPGARRILETARDRGLKYFSLSVDEYHHPDLTDEEVVRLLREALRLGINVSLKGTGRKARARWQRLARDKTLSRVHVRRGWEDLERVGEAARLSHDHHQSTRAMLSCDTLLRPIVLPDGSLMACCSTRMFALKGTWLDLGNVLEEPLAVLLDRYQRNFLVAGIIALGPLGLLRKTGVAFAPEGKTRCGFCVDWVRRQRVCAQVEQRVAGDLDLRKEIAARVMLLEAALGVAEWGVSQ